MPEYRFDEIAILRNEKRTPVPEDKYTYVGLEHLDSGKLEVTRWGSEVDIKGEKLVMHKGDILFGRRNTYLKRAAIAPHDGLFSAHGMIFRPNTKVISERLFPFFIASDYFMDAAIRISVGSLSPTVNWKTLRELRFKLPPLDQQNELADLMQAANDTKVAYEQMLLQLDELVKSQFIEMFKGIQRGEYKSLKEVCTLITDGTHNPPKFKDSGIPFILVSNITGNIVTYDTPKYISEDDYNVLTKRTPIEKGDVLLSTVGSYGHPAIVTEDRPFAFQRHIAHLKPNRELLTSEFLHAAILSSVVQEQIEVLVLGVAQKTLNLSAIKQIQIPVPTIEEQKLFVTFVEQSDKSKFELKQAIERVTNLMKSLMQQDFVN